ncbi:MAG TPA: alpha/beta fold hydrolase, partial [Aquihabitans sp.]|nr:alpha/beta fold hydrolase [Aquihabitans sp.]
MITTHTLSFGPCDVRLDGDEQGEPVLLVHGALVDGTLWDRIVPALAERHRVIRPSLPIGAHRHPAAHRDLLHPEALADSLVELLDRLDVERAVVVGNDTGGAISQILAARHPDRVSSLVLTSSDALDHFPPTALKPVIPLLRFPAAVRLLERAYRSRRGRRSPLGVGLVMKRPIDDAVISPWFDEIGAHPESLHDTAAFLRSCRPALAHAAADALRSFPRPVLVAWSEDDLIFPKADARRLAEMIPHATLRWITDARTFSMV